MLILYIGKNFTRVRVLEAMVRFGLGHVRLELRLRTYIATIYNVDCR